MSFCPECFAACDEETDRHVVRYTCPDCGDVDEVLSVADLADEARDGFAAARLLEHYAGRVTALMREGHELPADVLAFLADVAARRQPRGPIGWHAVTVRPCDFCAERLGEVAPGRGDTSVCPTCLPKFLPGFAGTAKSAPAPVMPALPARIQR